MTPNEIKKYLPHASAATIKANVDVPVAPRVSPAKFKQGDADALPPPAKGAHPCGGRTLVCITRYGPRLLDRDNLAGSGKTICDALRHAGLIAADDPNSIVLYSRQFKAPKAEQGTEVVIEYVPDNHHIPE